MPLTLYRYILVELLRIMAVTTLVLVTVVSFAAAVKPMSDGLVGGPMLLKFVLYTTPTMLPFVLPFAGAFAATMVFSRMAQDNEITACCASGLSYRLILYPVLALGLMMTVAMYGLTNWIVPHFYARTARLVYTDISRLIVSRIEGGQPVVFDGRMLYADAAAETSDIPPMPDSDVQPDRLIVLKRVAVADLGKDKTIQREGTADQANVFLFEHGGRTWATIQLRNAMWYSPTEGRVELASTDIRPQPLDDPVRDNPKFFTSARLRQLRDHPESYDQIQQRKSDLVMAMTTERLLHRLEASLAQAVTFTMPGGDTYIIRSPQVERVDGMLHLGASDTQRVLVDYLQRGLLTRQYTADRATLWIDAGNVYPDPRVAVELESVRVVDRKLGGPGTEHHVFRLPRFRWGIEAYRELAGTPASELMTMAVTQFAASEPVRKMHEQLELTRKTVIYRVIAQLNKRLASAWSILFVMLLGAVLALRLRMQSPLVVFFLVFLLTIVSIIVSESGETLISRLDTPTSVGLLLLWSGNGILAVVLTHAYLRVVRN